MPYQMRRMFVYICVFCNPNDPLKLWDKFKLNLCEDFAYHNVEDAENYALNDIESVLRSHSMSLADFNLPFAAPINEEISEDILDRFNIEVEANAAESHRKTLNEDQKVAIEEILHSIDNNEA